MIIAAAYVRVSTDEQTDYSPSAQLADIREYARQNGYHIPDEFVFMDEGISGKRADKRPAFQSMIRQARKKSNHIQYIIVHKFDRFARNKEDSVLYKALLKKDGVKVISVKEPIPQDDKFAVIYESMLEAMAEYYSLNLAEEVNKTMIKKAQAGEWQATAPFGYKNENKSLSVVPEEAKMIRYIFEQYIAGTSMFALSRQMNQMGYRTHRGNVFENRTIQYIINNPVYKGYSRWTPGRMHLRDYSDPASIISKGNWEPIVSEEIWEAAVTRFKAEKRTYYKHKRPETEGIHWLSSMVKCSACGRSLIVGTKYKNGAVQFQCGGYNHGQCHDSHAISSNRLIPALLSELEKIAAHPNTEGCRYTIRREFPASHELDVYVPLLAKAQQRLKKAKDAYLNDIDTLEEYRSNKTSIEKEIAELKEHIAEIEEQQKMPFDQAAFSTKIASVIEILRDESRSMEDRRKAFKSVCEKVIYNKHTNSLELFLIDG
ncbi:recombinase family protein [Anaerotignum faecicola]|jgi:site-specific DNA recombinase